MGSFKNLIVWQKAKDLAVSIYKITNTGSIAKDFGLRDQMRRSAVSIPSNIAEGDDLGTDKQAIRHFYIARGSVAELLTQLLIAEEIGCLDKGVSSLLNEFQLISAMLYKLILSRKED
jgi:four helix bundle protein